MPETVDLSVFTLESEAKYDKAIRLIGKAFAKDLVDPVTGAGALTHLAAVSLCMLGVPKEAAVAYFSAQYDAGAIKIAAAEEKASTGGFL